MCPCRLIRYYCKGFEIYAFYKFISFVKLNFFLIGSNLKFKLTEFGTLEIISTVETEKGEITWSTPTEHRKSTSDETNDVPKEVTPAKKDKGTNTELLGL